MPKDQDHIIEIKPTGDPFSGGWEASESVDGGKSWVYRGDINGTSHMSGRDKSLRYLRRTNPDAVVKIDPRYR